MESYWLKCWICQWINVGFWHASVHSILFRHKMMSLLNKVLCSVVNLSTSKWLMLIQVLKENRKSMKNLAFYDILKYLGNFWDFLCIWIHWTAKTEKYFKYKCPYIFNGSECNNLKIYNQSKNHLLQKSPKNVFIQDPFNWSWEIVYPSLSDETKKN